MIVNCPILKAGLVIRLILNLPNCLWFFSVLRGEDPPCAWACQWWPRACSWVSLDSLIPLQEMLMTSGQSLLPRVLRTLWGTWWRKWNGSHYGKQYEVFPKTQTRTAIQSSNSTSAQNPNQNCHTTQKFHFSPFSLQNQKNWNLHLKKILVPTLLIIVLFTANRNKSNVSQWWMNKRNVMCDMCLSHMYINKYSLKHIYYIYIYSHIIHIQSHT